MGKAIKGFFDKCKAFLYKNRSTDISFSADFLALVRIGCLGSILLSLGIIFILINFFHAPDLALAITILAIGVFCLFVVSYFQKRFFLLTIYLFCLVATIMLTLYTLWFGVQIGYHLGILILIFVTFYQTDNRTHKYFEFFISLCFILYSYEVWYYAFFHGAILPVSQQDNLALSVGFMIWIGLSVITLAWFYHVKFTKNEEDLLVYNEQLKSLTKQDALTKLKNRRGITDEIGKLVKSSTDLYFVMCDIDFFKKVNDTYGHDIGDKVLVRVSEIIRENISKECLLGRWGGEEFLLVIPDKMQQQVIDKVESLRMAIAKETFIVTKEKKFFVTMTFGVAQHYFNKYTIEQSIKRADENLYIGKERGRNCVIF